MEVKVVNYCDVKEGTRFREEYGDIESLALSIKNEGLIQPLAVRDNEDGTYLLLAGGRRYKAAGLASLTTLPVRVYEKDIDELTMRSIELMENIIRKDLRWWETANLKKEVHELQIKIHGEKKSTSPDAPGWSKAMTAKLIGGAESLVHDDIKLAEAIAIMPQLKTAKNRSEAQKMLRGVEETMIRTELAKKVQEKTATTSLERVQHEMINRYMVGDFFEIVKKLPDKSIDIIELDPPYGIDLHDVKDSLSNNFYNKDNYNEVVAEKYEQFINNVLTECYRIMSDNSWLICWFAIEPWMEEVYHAIRAAGFNTTRIVGFWAKPSGQTKAPQYYLANAYEPFFYARKGSPIISKQGRSNIFNFKSVFQNRKVHPTERPIELIQEILSTFGWTGARVFVPFLGSGNTILSAANLGMQAFGCDLAQDYKNSFIVKCTSCAPGSYKSYREVGDEEST